MGFLAPWFFGGLAALGVPVFVHLLRRHVTTPRPVSRPGSFGPASLCWNRTSFIGYLP